MYTQILKEILLTIDFKEKHFQDFIIYCRELVINNTIELENLDKLEKEYPLHTPIWWYTYQCFLYSMLDKALRTMEVDLIIFFFFFFFFFIMLKNNCDPKILTVHMVNKKKRENITKQR